MDFLVYTNSEFLEKLSWHFSAIIITLDSNIVIIVIVLEGSHHAARGQSKHVSPFVSHESYNNN